MVLVSVGSPHRGRCRLDHRRSTRCSIPIRSSRRRIGERRARSSLRTPSMAVLDRLGRTPGRICHTRQNPTWEPAARGQRGGGPPRVAPHQGDYRSLDIHSWPWLHFVVSLRSEVEIRHAARHLDEDRPIALEPRCDARIQVRRDFLEREVRIQQRPLAGASHQ